MTVELLHTLSTAALIAAGVLFLLSIILFFVFRIPSLIGILSGSTERKAIENIRHKNEMGESVVDDTDNNRAKSNMADADTERRTGTVKLSTDANYHFD